jgi:hypothetical protein
MRMSGATLGSGTSRPGDSSTRTSPQKRSRDGVVRALPPTGTSVSAVERT